MVCLNGDGPMGSKQNMEYREVHPKVGFLYDAMVTRAHGALDPPIVIHRDYQGNGDHKHHF